MRAQCEEIQFRRPSRHPSSLFDSLSLDYNKLTSIADCIGQLTNLTLYGIRFVI